MKQAPVVETNQFKPMTKRMKLEKENQLNETLKGTSGYQIPDSEERKIILDSVDIHSQYEETTRETTLGDLIINWNDRMVPERLIGQRDEDYNEEEDADWNKNILMGFLKNQSIHLVDIPELLKGFKDKLQSASNENMRTFYERRIAKCHQHLQDGKDLHLADGQHRMLHIMRVFSPDSTVPIKLREEHIWTRHTTGKISGNPQKEKYDLRGKFMAEMPEDVRHRILELKVSLQITKTRDDVLVAEMFLADNSGTPALPSAKVGILARSPFKSQLEQMEQEVDSNPLSFKGISKLAHWSSMDFLKDRLYSTVDYRSPWSRNANGFQSYIMNAVIRWFGDDFSNTGIDLQGKIRFADPGFQEGKGILLHEDAELSERNYHTTIEILQGMATAHDKLVKPKNKKVSEWVGRYRISNFVNDILVAEIVLNGKDFAGKYKAENWGGILSEFAEWDRNEQADNRYEIGKNGSIKQRKLSNGDYKPVERNEGYYHDSNTNQHQKSFLEYRSEVIRDEFCLPRKDSWLANGWLIEVVDRAKTRNLIRNYWEKQDGKCAVSGTPIAEGQLTNGDVNIDYDSNRTGRLVLSRLLQEKSLDNLLEI